MTSFKRGCILSTGGSSPHFRVYQKHNPDGVVTPGSAFDDYYLDLDFIFNLWMSIENDPMECQLPRTKVRGLKGDR